MLFNSDLKLPLWEQNLMIFQLHFHFLDLSWSILGLKHVFFDSWYIPNGYCFQSFWVIVLLNSDLKLPLWEQSLMIFLLHLDFFDLSWSILGLKHVFFDSWYIPNGYCFQSFWVIVLLNSDLKLPLWEQSLMIFLLHLNFFDLSWSILGLKHVLLDPWYIPLE